MCSYRIRYALVLTGLDTHWFLHDYIRTFHDKVCIGSNRIRYALLLKRLYTYLVLT